MIDSEGISRMARFGKIRVDGNAWIRLASPPAGDANAVKGQIPDVVTLVPH
jgi:hypothetical protein